MSSKHLYNLGPKEKLVIQRLGKEGPLTGFDLHHGGKPIKIGLNESRQPDISDPYWLKMRKKLLGIGLIQEVHDPAFDIRHKQKYYWLTGDGIVYACGLGVKMRTMRKFMEKLDKHTFDEELTAMVQVVDAVNSEFGPDAMLGVWLGLKSKNLDIVKAAKTLALPYAEDKSMRTRLNNIQFPDGRRFKNILSDLADDLHKAATGIIENED